MASYLLQTGSVFAIGAADPFATLDFNVISGEVTIDNQFYDARVWGDDATAGDGAVEGRGRYQAIGNVRAFHDSANAAAVLTDFAPGTATSTLTMTLVGVDATAKTFTCEALIHNFHIVGDRQKPGPVEVTWSFRSVGDLTTVTI